MATLAPSRDMLVIRLVYDGPPQSGKTTSLRRLAGSLSRQLTSPDEADGRTLLFDWLDYVGGSYEGLPIRCQIVSVPGQRALHRRRQALLATADAVVFVADTTRRRIDETVAYLGELRAFLDTRQGPRPGVVLQANKRDAADAESLASLGGRLGAGAFDPQAGSGGLALVESIATEGTGIREAFVLSVRLALDRVREMAAAGTLAIRPPEADDPGQLTAQIRSYEQRAGAVAATAADGPATPLAAQALREVLAGEDDLVLPGASRTPVPFFTGPNPAPLGVERRRPPRLPDSTAPSGRVWPPVEGRLVLHAASSAAPIPPAPHQRPDGAWQARIGDWQLHSMAAHEFDDLEGAREELLNWARLYAAGSRRLAPQRCLVLAATGRQRWRLWQIVHAEESLRQRLSTALAQGDPQELAGALRLCGTRLLEARELFASEPPLPCRLGTIGAVHPTPLYIGLLPPHSWVPPAGEFEAEDDLLVRREIEPLVRRALGARAIQVPGTLDALASLGLLPGPHRRASDALAAMLIGH